MFKNIRFSWIYIFCMSIYVGLSYKLFTKINNVSGLVVDEIFHIPQGKLFCEGNFSYYDPKITTPAGLYWASALALGPLQLCGTYWLRLFNLAVGVLNVELVRRLLATGARPPRLTALQCKTHELLAALALASLPPSYFFSHLYYTDTLSGCGVLLAWLAARHGRLLTCLLLGAASVAVRQTNVVWLSAAYGETLVTLLLQVLLTGLGEQRVSRTRFSLRPDVALALTRLHTLPARLHLVRARELAAGALYAALVALLAALAYRNGGVALGDKSAHTLTLHVPQLFYFALFTLLFSGPQLAACVPAFGAACRRHTAAMLALAAACALLVYANTHVHPYLLADNRHYTFYIWNRFLSRPLVRYGLVIVYIFVWYAIYHKLINMTSFQYTFVFSCGTFLSLAFQKLIDVRYFFLPYLAFRIRTNSYNKYLLGAELLISLIINILSLNVYFGKEFQWKEFDYSQRIIW